MSPRKQTQNFIGRNRADAILVTHLWPVSTDNEEERGVGTGLSFASLPRLH